MADNNVIITPNTPPLPKTPSAAPSVERVTSIVKLIAKVAAGAARLTEFDLDDRIAEKLLWASEQPWIMDLLTQVIGLFDKGKEPSQTEINSLIQAAISKKG